MANQYTQAANETQRARVLAFVRAHPECTTHDLRNAFGIDVMNAGVCLTSLRNAGLVRSEREPGELLARWYVVPKKRATKKEIEVAPVKQRFVSDWTCTTRPGEFERLFFGAAQVAA
jgi:DNA-binding transcriptional ArsR family regulator